MQTLPKLWLWTRQLTWEVCERTVKTALSLWYRHIDTASKYVNEEWVGKGWESSWIPRNDLRLTTKARMDTYPSLSQSLEQSLQKLQTDYIDLFLLHRPTTTEEHEKCFDVLFQLQQEGKIKYFGISNFTLAQTQHAREYTGGKIFTNQVEYHLELDQSGIKSFADEHWFVLTAYSPLGHGHLLKNPALLPIAEKHSVSVAQVCIAWLLQQGCTVLPKASSQKRLTENLASLHLTLDAEDLKIIASLPKTHRYVDPPFAPKRD